MFNQTESETKSNQWVNKDFNLNTKKISNSREIFLKWFGRWQGRCSFIRQYVYWGQTANFCSSNHDVLISVKLQKINKITTWWVAERVPHLLPTTNRCLACGHLMLFKLLMATWMGAALPSCHISEDTSPGLRISGRQVTNSQSGGELTTIAPSKDDSAGSPISGRQAIKCQFGWWPKFIIVRSILQCWSADFQSSN